MEGRNILVTISNTEGDSLNEKLFDKENIFNNFGTLMEILACDQPFRFRINEINIPDLIIFISYMKICFENSKLFILLQWLIEEFSNLRGQAFRGQTIQLY